MEFNLKFSTLSPPGTPAPLKTHKQTPYCTPKYWGALKLRWCVTSSCLCYLLRCHYPISSVLKTCLGFDVLYLVCKHRKDIALRSYCGLFLSLWEHLLDLKLHNNNGIIVNRCLLLISREYNKISTYWDLEKRGRGGGRSMDDGKKKQKRDKKRVKSVKYGINIWLGKCIV